jgi:hypothetical protein
MAVALLVIIAAAGVLRLGSDFGARATSSPGPISGESHQPSLGVSPEIGVDGRVMQGPGSSNVSGQGRDGAVGRLGDGRGAIAPAGSGADAREFDPGWTIPPVDPARSGIAGRSATRAVDSDDLTSVPLVDPWRPTKARGPDVVVHDPSLPSAVTIPPGATWIRSVGIVAVSVHGPGSRATLDGRPMEPGRVYLIDGDWQVETETGAGLHFRPPVPGDPPPEGRG